MPNVQQWGRRESIIWPPRGYLYTLGAFFLACVATGFFIYVRFLYGLSPLERYYLPYYLRSGMAGLAHPANAYRMLRIRDGKSQGRLALDADVQLGTTLQSEGAPLPLMLTPQAAQDGRYLIYREPLRSYQNKAIHAWIGHWIYGDIPLYGFFEMQLWFGLAAFVLQLPFSIRKDIARIRQLRYGRRLKGPVLVNAKAFTRAVTGDGIGITTNDSMRPLRIPRDAENKHFLIVGDTGSGKSSIIRQMLYQVDTRGDSAIVYDPACEFVKQFYDPHRGDIVLNPLDARMPYWNPSRELRRKAEAKALAVSLYQPEGVTNRFFVEAPQKIFSHLLSFLPTPEELVHWMSDPEEIDRRVRKTEYWALIDPKAPQQRTGVLGSLNMSADSFRLLPTQDETTSVWTATEWAKTRRGWIFITSRPTMREALRPLISLWIDTLVLRLLNEPMPDQIPVWFVIDELASLQRLPQLHTAITENRKSQNPVILGFQGRSQMEARYGEDAEAMLSQPATKIFLRTTEPRAAKWVSEAIGEIEIEQLRETHYDGTRSGRNFMLDRQTEPLVLPSEVSGLDDLRGFLKYGNHVARFSFPFIALEESSPGFDERKMDDLIVPNTPLPADPQEVSGNLLSPEHPEQHTGHEIK
ncbi:MAG TPA: type IV secretion system DNA-binding domain-containing protein [Candidatus Sulfotelmatobacter sp.]|nr:type IV secretion system DNA-binding domain-containing protein [Candidatus Sulfotelmatobacter sp.]